MAAIIPKILFQTSIKKPEQYVIDKFTSNMTNEWKYYHFNDNEIIDFFKKNYLEEFSDIIAKFNSMQKGAHKADLFRYYYLYINGGIFLDSDAMLEMNMEELILDESFISILSKSHTDEIIFNGFIGAIPRNEIIYKALKDVYNISNVLLNSYYHVLCRNLFFIINNKKYDFKIKLFQEETYDQYLKSGYDYTQTRDENNNIVLKHYWCNKVIPI
jgi:hypothetical protein